MSTAYPRGPLGGQSDEKDEKDLNTLVILTKIYAWYCLLCVLLCLGVGAAFLYFLPLMSKDATPSDRFAIGIFGPAMLLSSLLCGALAWLYFKAADCIKKRQNKTLIYVAAALACTNAPLGIGLGIYTFILLERPSIKPLFG